MKKIICTTIIGIISLFSLTGCGSSSSSYEDTLKSGLNKYYSGDAMTKQEYKAVKSFNKWKSNQGSKTYSEWD